MNDDQNDDRRDEVRDLLAAWALDAVDDVERATVDRALRDDPALAAEARSLQETTALLAASGSTAAPAHLRGSVLDRIGSTAQVGTVASGPLQASTPRSVTARSARPRPVGRWLAVAAAFIVSVGIPAGIAVQQSQRADRVQQQAEAVADILARPGAQVVQSDVTGGGRAVAVLAGNDAVFTAADLPDLDEGDYQLWVVAEGAPVSAGVLALSDGAATASVSTVPEGAALALTVEPVGGSEQPTTEPVVVLAAG